MSESGITSGRFWLSRRGLILIGSLALLFFSGPFVRDDVFPRGLTGEEGTKRDWVASRLRSFLVVFIYGRDTIVWRLTKIRVHESA